MPCLSTPTCWPKFTENGTVAFRELLSPPFSHVGIDFAGPLYVQGSPSPHKSYVCIFTCASSRMVHLELTSSQSTNEFLQAFNRMISRRGICSTVWSDNAKTFKCADRKIRRLYKSQSSNSNKSWGDIDQDELQAKLASKGIKWKFIVERSPWRGGWWERLIRNVKEPLRKVLGKALLSYSELATESELSLTESKLSLTPDPSQQ